MKPRRVRALRLWLGAVAALVFAMVLVGGATRLTDSGLSITEWDLGKGLTPPLGAERWPKEFALYRRTTEYQLQNRGMSLAEFQYIYWWEWAHRFLGKMIGVVFALPFAVFWATGRLKRRFWPVLGLFAMGGLQGAIGWWMVTSGLFGRVDVSPVRLAIHLGMAFAILGYTLWLLFGLGERAPAASRSRSTAWSPRSRSHHRAWETMLAGGRPVYALTSRRGPASGRSLNSGSTRLRVSTTSRTPDHSFGSPNLVVRGGHQHGVESGEGLRRARHGTSCPGCTCACAAPRGNAGRSTPPARHPCAAARSA